MKIASLDLGSNSFLCLLCEADEQGIFNIYKDMVEVVRLGQEINKTKRIHPEALIRAKNCLTRFKAEIDLYQPDKIIAYATSAARDAENNHEFFKIGKDLGINIEIIPGTKEALATYRGVFWGKTDNSSGQKKNLLIDIGGGSTEIILGQGMGIIDSMSLNMGAVRMTEKWITKYPVSDLESKALKDDVVLSLASHLKKIQLNKPDAVYAVAGTPTTLAAAEMGGKFDPEKVEGFEFSIDDLSQWETKLSTSSLEEIISLHKIPKGRADIIYSGIVILKTILEAVGSNKVVVSTRGVRFGIVADQFLFLICLMMVLSLPLSLSAKAPTLQVDSNKVEKLDVVKFKKGSLKIKNKLLKIEVAETPEQYSYGLMNRLKLGEDEGMLFIFNEEEERFFWMKNTFINLSIAYIDKNKKIIDIQDMKAATSSLDENLPSYPSKGKAMYALEVNQGWFLRNGIKVGNFITDLKVLK